MNKSIIYLSLLSSLFFFSISSAQTPTEIWDMEYLTDSTNLDVDTLWINDTTFSGFNFRVAEIRYNSVGDPGETIRIQGFLAIYLGGGTSIPGVVVGHGNGGEGNLITALSTAMTLQSTTLSISAPGCGLSEGRGSEPENWVRAYPDPRESWIYQYACAGIRGITYLTTLSQVDTDFLCVTGVSAGGIMSWLVNGVDDRIKVCMPIMATGDWETSYRDSSWLYYEAFDTMDIDNPAVQNLIIYLDPINYTGTQYGSIFMIIGAQDEIFPINCARNHYSRLNAIRARIYVIPDWDHAVYYGADPRYSGQYDAYNNTEFFARKSIQAMVAYFLGMRTAGFALPTPQVTANQIGNNLNFNAIVSPGLQDTVFLWVSMDSGWTYQSYRMTLGYVSSFTYTLELPPNRNLTNIIYFIECIGTGFILSSNPYVPNGLYPRVRPPVDLSYIVETEKYKNDFEIYPNPSRGNVFFSLKNNLDINNDIEIFDILGRKVVSIKENNWNGLLKNGTKAPIGIYLARIRINDNNIINKKFLIIK